MLTDYQFEALGVPRNPEILANRAHDYYDMGLCGPLRRDQSDQSKFCGLFKTPTLRNVAMFVGLGNHGGGPAFEPVVKFVNRYRAAPRRVADRVFVSCGVYEPLIVRNRSMVPTFEAAGMDVRYVEARDGHSWENWRDRLREGLSWIFPGPQKFFYE